MISTHNGFFLHTDEKEVTHYSKTMFPAPGQLTTKDSEKFNFTTKYIELHLRLPESLNNNFEQHN